jgi:hypothetical protein
MSQIKDSTIDGLPQIVAYTSTHTALVSKTVVSKG